MEEEGRIVPAGRTAEGKAVGVRQTGPPWRFWYEGREIAGPEGGAVEKGRYVVKQKGGNLELLRREVVKGEGWAVWIDDEALGEYERARVVVHPPSLTRGVPHPTHTNGAPLNTIAAFFSSGRHLLGGGSCCSKTDLPKRHRGPTVPAKFISDHITGVVQSVKPSDRKAKETRLVQWFKEHEMQLMLQGISLGAGSLYNNCIDMLHLVEESMVKEDELFFSVYISQAVAKVGLALLLNSATRSKIDTRLKKLINGLLKKKPPNMVFYELEWLRKGLEIVKEIEDFEWDTVDILIKCVTSITSMSFSVVLTDLLNLSRKAYSMAKGISEHNHYFGIAAIERTAAVVKNRLLWYHLLQADEKAAAKAELKTYLLEVQSERGRLETWEVAFAWVKLIADILIFNPAVVTQASINKLLKDENMDGHDVTLEGLRAKGWLVEHTSDGGKHNVSVLTSSFSGHWRSGSTDDITNMLDKHPRQPIPNDLQELLVTGSEGFHGLAHFAKMGISTPRSLVVVLEEANTLLKGKKPVNEMQQGLKGLLNNTLNGAANFAGLFVENKANIWRVRDRAVVACIDVLSRNNVSAPCARELQATLTNCEVFEQNSDVRRTLKNPGVYKETAAFLKKSWKTQEEEVQESIKTTMDRLEELQHSMLNCTLPNITKELRAVMNEVNNELDHQVKSLQGMQEKLGVTLDFLMGIQRRQLSMEKNLNDLLRHLGADESIPDICKERMKEVRLQKQPAVYLTPYGDAVEETLTAASTESPPRTPVPCDNVELELLEHAWDMIDDPTKNTLLITGRSGGGKSTFMKKLHTDLWKHYWGSQEKSSVFTIPLFCSLPELRDPRSGLVEEAFAKCGVQGPLLLQRIKTECRAGKCRLIFILDSYNEMCADYRYTNLYQSNNLRKWGEKQLEDAPVNAPYPKIVITCRQEFVDSNRNYRKYFHPIQEGLNFKEALSVVRIRDFRKRTCEYLNRDYEDQIKRLSRECDVSEEYVDSMTMKAETVVGVQAEGQTEQPYSSLIEQLKKDHDHVGELTTDDINELTSVPSERKFLSELQNIWSPLKLFRAAANSVGQLLSTPFMLSILVKVIPVMFSDETNPSRSKALLKYDTYHTFVNLLLDKSLPNLVAKHTTVPEGRLRLDFENYCKGLARLMTLENQVRVHYESSGELFQQPATKYTEYFSSDNTLLKDIREGAPLQTEQAGVGGRYYVFIHQSIQEFFVAQLVYDAVMRFPMLENLSLVKGFVSYFLGCDSVTTHDQLKAILPKRKTHFFNTFESIDGVPETQSQIMAALEADWSYVNTALVVNDTAVMSQFLTPKVRADKKFQRALLSLVELSKLPYAQVPASMAISILNSAVSFSGMDLSGIRVPKAELSSAVFHETDLSGADLCGSDLSGSYFHKTRLDGADMKDVDFKQEPDIMHRGVHAIATKPKANLWATVSHNTIKVGKHSIPFLEGKPPDFRVAFECKFHGDTLRVACRDGIYDVTMEDGKLRKEKTANQLNFCTNKGRITALKFSNDGSTLIAGSSKDGIQIIDANGVQKLLDAPLNGDNASALAVRSTHGVATHVAMMLGSNGERKTSFGKCGVANGKLLYTESHSTKPHQALEYSPNGRYLAMGGDHPKLIDLDTNSEKWMSDVFKEKVHITDVDFSPNGQVLAMGSRTDVCTWSVQTGMQLRQFNVLLRLYSMGLSDSQLCISSGSHTNETVKMWDIKEEDNAAKLAKHAENPKACLITPGERHLLTSVGTDKVIRWDLETGEMLDSTHNHVDDYFSGKKVHLLRDILKGVQAAERGQALALQDRPADLISPDLRHAFIGVSTTEKPTIVRLTGHEDPGINRRVSCNIRNRCFSEDGVKYAYRFRNSIFVGDVGELIERGDALRSFGESGEVTERQVEGIVVHNPDNEREIETGMTGIKHFCFSKDGSRIAVGSTDSMLRTSILIYDSSTAGLVAQLTVNDVMKERMSFTKSFLLVHCKSNTFLWKWSGVKWLLHRRISASPLDFNADIEGVKNLSQHNLDILQQKNDVGSMIQKIVVGKTGDTFCDVTIDARRTGTACWRVITATTDLNDNLAAGSVDVSGGASTSFTAQWDEKHEESLLVIKVKDETGFCEEHEISLK